MTAFELDNLVVAFGLGNLRFDNQIEIEGGGAEAFSDGGDSGALIVDTDRRGVALLFAGGDVGGTNGQGLTFAHPLAAVRDALDVDLLTGRVVRIPAMATLPSCTLAQARAAKPRVQAVFQRLLPVVGVGVTRVDDGYGVKVNLSAPPPANADLPRLVEGVPVRVEVVGTVRKE